jgi:hypothetical protein
VAGYEHGDAFSGEAAQQGAHLDDTGRVQAIQGFVQDQQAWRAEQGKSDRQALAHAHRVFAHAPVGVRAELHARQYFGDALARRTEQPPRHFQVLAAAEVAIQRRRFDQRPGMAQRRAAMPIQWFAEQFDGAGVGAQQAEQQADAGGLASAVGAEEAIDRALGNLEVERVHAVSAGEHAAEAARADRRDGWVLGHGPKDARAPAPASMCRRFTN